MEQSKVETKQCFEEQKKLHDITVKEIKSETQKHVLNVKSDLEMQLRNQKVGCVRLCISQCYDNFCLCFSFGIISYLTRQ